MAKVLVTRNVIESLLFMGEARITDARFLEDGYTIEFTIDGAHVPDTDGQVDVIRTSARTMESIRFERV